MTHEINRRTALSLLAGSALLPGLPNAAFAAGYPDRPVHFVVPFPPGGAVDIVARTISEAAGPRLGQTIVVDNRPGASGNIAYGYVAAAVCVLIGPVFIPWFIVPKMDWLFWGWLKAFIGFSFYQVIASAFIYVFAKVLAGMFQTIGAITIENALTILPALLVTLFVCVYGLTKIPELTSAILSGRTGTWVNVMGD